MKHYNNLPENIYLHAFVLALRYIRPYKTYWLWFILRIIYIGITILVPIFLGKTIDILSTSPIDINNIIIYAGICFLLEFISPSLGVFTVQKVPEISNKIALDFRCDATRMLSRANVNFFNNVNRGVYVKIIDAAQHNIYRITEDISHRYISTLAQIVGVFIAAFVLKASLIAIFGLSLVLFLTNFIVFTKKEKTSGLLLTQSQEVATGGLTEFLYNFKTIFYLDLFNQQEKSLFIKANNVYTNKLLAIKYSLQKWYNDGQLEQLTSGAVFILGIIQVIQGNMTVGMLVTILGFAKKLAGQQGTILALGEAYTEYATTLQRYRDALIRPLLENNFEPTGLLHDQPFQKLTLKSISVHRESRDTIKNISFTAKAGQRIAVIGHTGSGKSTLLDVILKAITEYTGTVTINEINYLSINSKDITSIFSVVPQEVQLFRGTIRENILIHNQNVSDEDIYQILRVCALDTFINHLPKRLDEEIYEGATNISGGERQRLGIARALLQKQPVLILDEATASLDPITEQHVISQIIETFPDILVLYVTHKYATLQYFDHIIVMQEGEAVEQGSFKKLQKESHIFKTLYAASQAHND